MRYNTILFDLDGTIIDSAEGIFKSFAYALKKLGYPVPEPMPAEVIGPPLTDSFRRTFHLPESEIDLACETYRERYRPIGIFECRPYEGVEILLKALKASPAKIVLATSKPEEFAVRILEHIGLADCFDHVCGATFDSSRATKQSVLAYACEKAQISEKTDAVMVGDRYHDIEAAKALGLSSIGVTYGFGDEAELIGAGAGHIVRTASELLAWLLGE